LTIQRPDFHRPAVEGVTVDRDVMVAMRDGVRLAVDVYRPSELERAYPALLAIAAYQKDLAGLPAVPTYPNRETGPIEWYVKRGYVYVLADVRGTGKSEGDWEMLSMAEQQDYHDVIEWIAEQPWSSGKVGMIGQSYYGMAQWLAAIQRPPHLTCIAPYDASVDEYRESAMHGGIPSSGFITLWSFLVRGQHAYGPRGVEGLESLKANADHSILEHQEDDDYWRERSAYWRLDEIETPVFSIGNWGKNARHLRGNILGFERVRGPKKLLVEEGARPSSLNVAKALLDFESADFHERVLAPWYDHWLKGEDTGVMSEPPVEVFVSGVDEYRRYDRWPPAGASPVRWYLSSGPSGSVQSLNDGALTTDAPSAERSSTSYSYPQPEWHLGTAMINSAGLPNPVARILTFTSAPLEFALEVIGPVTLVLYASSDQVDTDFIVRLCDQQPDGDPLPDDVAPSAHIIGRGWLKASHRELDPAETTDLRPFHGHRDATPLEPGVAYRFDIEIWPVAHVFERGHRLRLELANGDSPVTEGIFTHFYGVKAGVDTIHHDVTRPSHLVLPTYSAA
jgi:uncharacterized protein